MIKKDKVRIGIFGGGGILGAHTPGLNAALDRCEVVAVAEPDAQKHGRIRDMLKNHPVHIYRDYQELLASATVDAVDILLPHHLHMPATIAAANAGCHVLVEKVMARNIWECDQMIEACRSVGVTLTVRHDRRYQPGWMELKKVIDSGLLGEIHYWKLDHNQDVNCAALLPWAARRDNLGGGAIMSCLTHQIDALRWYGGEVASVTCMGKVIPDRMEGETIGVILARMASGALAHLAINWFTRSKDGPNALWYEMVQATGSRGEAYFMHGRGTFVRLHDNSDPRDHFRIEGDVTPGCFAKLAVAASGDQTIHEWLNLLLGRPHHVTTSGEDSRRTVEVAEAAYRSEELGRVVELPIEAKPWQ